MKTTNDFLNAVMKKNGITSDNQLAIFIGCTRSSISGYRYNKSFMDDETALKVATLLDLDPGYVFACVATERARNPKIKAAWKHTAEILYGIAAVLATVYIVPTIPLPAYDGFNVALLGLAVPLEGGTLYISQMLLTVKATAVASF